MKSILAPIEDGPGMDAQLETTLLVARHFKSCIHGVAPRLVFGPNVFGDFVSAADVAAVEELEEEQLVRLRKVEQRFRDFMIQQSIELLSMDQDSDEVSASWISEIAPGDEAVGQLARLYDLAVVARPIANSQVPRASLLETILFESGHPILVVPPEPADHIGQVTLIAWNGSTESARVLYFALPFLHRAEKVIILKVEGGPVVGPGSREVKRALKRHNIESETIDIAASDKPIGEVILAEARNLAADLLIKGAYTQSRLRQMIFGGATSTIMAKSEIPVLMTH